MSNYKKIINLMFHDVKIKPSRWNLPPASFNSLIDIIVNTNKEITITIDDGGVGNYNYILPILEQYHLKAFFFIPTSFISSPGRSSSNYMNRTQIKEISSLGHTIGSHSHTHPKNISLLSPEQVLDEWLTSKKILEDITGSAINSCSFPGGFYHRSQLGILNSLGYNSIYNSLPTYTTTVLQNITINGRFSIERDTTVTSLNAILRENKLNQLFLYGRHTISKQYHTLLHKLW